MFKRLISMIVSVVFVLAMLPTAISAQTDNTIKCSIAMYNLVGREVPAGTALEAGNYQLTVKAQNIQNDVKGINVYLAIKTDGILTDLNQGYIEVKSSTSAEKNAQKTFNVTIPDGRENNTEISVYYWDSSMKPFSEKLVWGENLNSTYTVYGRITATQHSDLALKTGTVKFSMEYSDNFEGNPITPDMGKSYKMNYDGAANDMLFIYARAIIEVNEKNVYTILSLTQADDNTVSFKTSDVDSYSNNRLYIYADGDSTQKITYNLSSNTEVYVNGARIYLSVSDMISKYIFNNSTGTMKLIDSLKTGEYDRVMITYYESMIIDTISETNGVYTVEFVSDNAAEKISIDIDTEDADTEYSINLADGTKIQPEKLKKGDVLSIAYDMTYSMDNSRFYDILVSRSRVNGEVCEQSYDVFGKTYIVNTGTERVTIFADDSIVVYLGTKYCFYLDVFGRAVYAEELCDPNPLCILESVYKAYGDQCYALIITSDGKKESHEIQDNFYNTYTQLCYSNVSDEIKRPVSERVFGYRIFESSGILRLDTTPYAAKIVEQAEYDTTSYKIGEIEINPTTTAILDFTMYVSDRSVYSIEIDNLETDAAYSAMAFGKNTDDTYQLVLITQYTNIWYKSKFRIFEKRNRIIDSEGIDRFKYTLCGTDGEKSEILLDDDSIDISYLSAGMPVMFKKNMCGYATAIYPLFAESTTLEDYSRFAISSREGIRNGSLTDVLNTDYLDLCLGNNVSSAINKSQWHFGLVYDVSYPKIVLAEGFDAMASADSPSLEYITDVDNLSEFYITDNSQILVYNYANRAGFRLEKGNANNIFKGIDYDAFVTGMTLDGKCFVKSDKVLFDWQSEVLISDESATEGKTSFALIKTDGKKVIQAYILTPENKQ